MSEENIKSTNFILSSTEKVLQQNTTHMVIMSLSLCTAHSQSKKAWRRIKS